MATPEKNADPMDLKKTSHSKSTTREVFKVELMALHTLQNMAQYIVHGGLNWEESVTMHRNCAAADPILVPMGGLGFNPYNLIDISTRFGRH